VDTLLHNALAASMKMLGVNRVPFIWFWPEGAPGCMMMTHDVEGPRGLAFCAELMDVDDSFGIKSSFQLVPEMRGDIALRLAAEIRRRSFEVNIHDLTHDAGLFHSRERFLRDAGQINRYARIFNCRGFRSGSMYRNQEWFDAFEFAYDMSVPSVAHLEPQRGGCCTVMPYFVGGLLELPLTTTQDYSLFHILGDYSTTLWREQIDLILAKHGMLSFIAHPDYLVDKRARQVYVELLTHVSRLRDERGLWCALPGEINDWWRARSEMSLVQHGGTWRIEGSGSERARLAYATLDRGRLVFELDEPRVERRRSNA
jgi:hypothetical protein